MPLPCHSNVLFVLALYLQLCSGESHLYMLGGFRHCDMKGRTNSFLTWIPLLMQVRVGAQMSGRSLPRVSRAILASLAMNAVFLTARGFLMPTGRFYFDEGEGEEKR